MEFVGCSAPRIKSRGGGWGVSVNPWDKEDPMEFGGSQSHGDGEGHRAPCYEGPPWNLGWSQTPQDKGDLAESGVVTEPSVRGGSRGDGKVAELPGHGEPLGGRGDERVPCGQGGHRPLC